MSTQKEENRWFYAAEKQSLWPFIHKMPIQKPGSAVLYTALYDFQVLFTLQDILKAATQVKPFPFGQMREPPLATTVS